MRKLTLEQTWRGHFRMWRWVVKEWKRSRGQASVSRLKARWCAEHLKESLWADCFFCAYSRQQGDTHSCSHCPGRLVSLRSLCIHQRFHCCNASYHYTDCPEAFLAKTEALYLKRKEQHGLPTQRKK